jgi:hypothetical protein
LPIMGAKIKTCSFDSSVLWPYNLVEDLGAR